LFFREAGPPVDKSNGGITIGTMGKGLFIRRRRKTAGLTGKGPVEGASFAGSRVFGGEKHGRCMTALVWRPPPGARGHDRLAHHEAGGSGAVTLAYGARRLSSFCLLDHQFVPFDITVFHQGQHVVRILGGYLDKGELVMDIYFPMSFTGQTRLAAIALRLSLPRRLWLRPTLRRSFVMAPWTFSFVGLLRQLNFLPLCS